MERQEIKQFVKRFWVIWVIALLLGAGFGIIFVKFSKPTYEATMTYVFTKDAEPLVGGTAYQYDHYYALEAANRVMSNFSTWISAPQSVSAIYAASGISLEGQSADQVSQLARVVTEKTNVLTLAFRKLSSVDEAKRLAAASQKYQAENFALPTGITITSEPSFISKIALPQPIIIGVAALALFVIAFAVTLIRQYFTETK